MAKTVAKLLGIVFILVGLCGFIMPGFLGSHLSLTHNLVHIISGAIALYFGFAGSLSGARMFCIIFGLVYGLLGVVGFLLGKPGPPPMPGMMGSNHLWTVIPGALVLGSRDHVIHILLGVLFLIGGFLTKPAAD